MEMADRLQIVMGDITSEEVDAIVNAANTDLLLGGGVAGAIRMRGGPSIQQECDRHGPVLLGQSALTNGGDLLAKHVIHAAVMHLGSQPDRQSIEKATVSALQMADKQQFHSISFPALGTGIGGFPVREAARLMLSSIKTHLANSDYPQIVKLVLFDYNALKVFKEESQRQ